MDQNEHPAASRRGFLRSGAMAALAGAVAAPVAVAAAEAPTLERLIAAELVAYVAFGAILDASGKFRPAPSPEHDASERWNEAMSACLDFPCATVGDFRLWAAFAATRLEDGSIDESWIISSLRALAGLPAEEEV